MPFSMAFIAPEKTHYGFKHKILLYPFVNLVHKLSDFMKFGQVDNLDSVDFNYSEIPLKT